MPIRLEMIFYLQKLIPETGSVNLRSKTHGWGKVSQHRAALSRICPGLIFWGDFGLLFLLGSYTNPIGINQDPEWNTFLDNRTARNNIRCRHLAL